VCSLQVDLPGLLLTHLTKTLIAKLECKSYTGVIMDAIERIKGTGEVSVFQLLRDLKLKDD
jgi:hypothetical protein